MRALGILVAALLSVASLPGFAADLPDSQTLRARSEAASGPVPTAFRQVIEFSGKAASGKQVIYARGTDRREVNDAGPLHTESGTNDGQRWHQNVNGHVVIDEADPGLATHDSTTTTVTRVSIPADAYVISELNAKGFGTREFIDAKTAYIVRRETLTPNGKVTTIYDDFKAFGARHLAGHWSEHDGPTGTETEYFNREYTAGDVSDTDVAIPAMKRALVEYPAGVNRVVLPSIFEPSGHVVIRLTINGRGLDLLLDTGASTITLNPDVASQLGLSAIMKMESSGNAGRFMTALAVVPQMSIGSLQMRNTVIAIAPWASVEPLVKTVGLVGFDFLCESGITIDYDHKIVTAERYGSYRPPDDPRTIALEVRLGMQVPLATANINGAIAERLLIDTGAVGPFMLFDYFQRRHPEALPRASANTPAIPFIGVGGRFDARPVKIDTFTLADVTFKDFTGFRVASEGSYSFSADGVIGPNFLHYFDLHLDYPNGMIYLVPNATGLKAAR